MATLGACLGLLSLLPALSLPNYQGCVAKEATSLPYCDESLSYDARIEDLISRLTLIEKINLVSNGDGHVNCNMPSGAVPRLGLPSYTWLIETNTGVHSVCNTPGQCATIFPDPQCVGASFNRTLWKAKGKVLGTEMRALHNTGGVIDRDSGLLVGLTGFGPNMNIIRDPRFGRAQELPGEDPYHTAQYSTEYLKGMQTPDANGYPLIRSYLKHFTAYSREYHRQHYDATVTHFDLYDTYLPQYEATFKNANASGVMCSYNGINGTPNCASKFLSDIIRKEWGATDALIMSDCGAIQDLTRYPWYAANSSEAVARTLLNGTDIEAGSNYFNISAADAIASGLVEESYLDAACKRTLKQRFELGLFDSVDKVEWTKIPAEAIGAKEHQKLSYEAALQGLVLLKNDGILPLRKGIKIAVVGPHAQSRHELFSDYYGNEVCFNKTWDCVMTISEAINMTNVGGTTLSQPAVKFVGGDDGPIDKAFDAALASDVLIIAVGTTAFQPPDIEHESYDRDNLQLPGLQTDAVISLLRLKIPSILVMVNGGPLAIDSILNLEPEYQPKAIIEAFFPGTHGGRALAASIFGDQNRWGKLPTTIYPLAYSAQVAMDDYSMSKAPGRTHRYYTGKPLFPFGFGLSLTNFTTKCTRNPTNEAGVASFSCDVSNTGDMDGEEVVLMYVKPSAELRSAAPHPVPLQNLKGFERVFVAKGMTESVSFDLAKRDFALVNEEGERVVYEGYGHYVSFSGTQPQGSAFRVDPKEL
mmetsp:Transcript_18741/g.36126  ORF Transcript_18741/g.36126 Transcript_18741/m.36126 type:complete len:757 (+) Transcript_18741:2-2272(+)